MVQKYDIAELMMQKYVINVDEGDHMVFYRLSMVSSSDTQASATNSIIMGASNFLTS